MAPSSKTSKTPTDASPLSSGIQTTSTGDRHIPQSTRADGSVRKEIKIRPGYRPPEDVEVYKNRTTEAFKNRGKGGIPGADGLKENIPNPTAAGSAASNKNAKRKEARKRAKAAGGAGDEGIEDEGGAEGQEETEVNGASKIPPHLQPSRRANDTNGTSSSSSIPTTVPEPQVDPEAEREKQARNLKKKLRQARELKEKKDSGGDLLPEQFAKVIKIQELIRQLDGLGFDENGEEKGKAKDAG